MINWTVGILLALFLGSLFVVEHLIHRKRWRSLSHPQDDLAPLNKGLVALAEATARAADKFGYNVQPVAQLGERHESDHRGNAEPDAIEEVAGSSPAGQHSLSFEGPGLTAGAREFFEEEAAKILAETVVEPIAPDGTLDFKHRADKAGEKPPNNLLLATITHWPNGETTVLRPPKPFLLFDHNGQLVEQRAFVDDFVPRVMILGDGFVERVYVAEESRFIGEIVRYHEAPTLRLDAHRPENAMG